MGEEDQEFVANITYNILLVGYRKPCYPPLNAFLNLKKLNITI